MLRILYIYIYKKKRQLDSWFFHFSIYLSDLNFVDYNSRKSAWPNPTIIYFPFQEIKQKERKRKSRVSLSKK